MSGRTRRAIPVLALLALLLQSTAALAGGVVVTIIDGRKAKADITLPNPGGGNYTAEFELEFEVDNLQNLTVACIGITADVLDAAEITSIEARLPHDAPAQIIDPAFPVRVTVEPPANCGLSFDYQYEVTYETDDLVYTPSSPYRLVKAPIGGEFRYVTGSVTQGSVRSRGSSGGFSEFVIIKDTRAQPDYATDCVDEYDALEARLNNSAIGLTARQALLTDLKVSRAAYDAGNFGDAIAFLANFYAHCAAYGGEALPNRWRSARDLDNIEGDLVGHADTLRFLMGRLIGTP
ncbi:MAG: DUF6689 family protein [Rhodanobacteraceae bacterium]